MIEHLKKHQPIAYRMLQNALKHHTVAHAYLFHGPKGTNKKEVALLFVQSLVCTHPNAEGFACGECDTCLRIKNGQYADLILLDGSQHSIKKEEIVSLQSQFSTTALEQYGKKFYILYGCENSSAAAMNSLLKFLEEPQGDITAILCTDQVERVLSTIVSRCQLIPFHLESHQAWENHALSEGMMALDAHLLSQIVNQRDEMCKTAQLEEYQVALTVWLTFIEKCYEDIRDGILYLQSEGFKPQAKEKLKNKDVLQWFLNIGVLFAQDCLHHQRVEDVKWNALLEQFSCLGISARQLISVLLQAKDSLLRNANVLLVVDQLGYYMIKEANKYGRTNPGTSIV